MDDRRPDPEFLASLALDDEIEHAELLNLLDAMADDPDVRAFWRAARGTEDLLDGLRAAPAARGVRPAARTAARVAPRRRVPIQAATSIAAVLLVAVGLLWFRPDGALKSTDASPDATHVATANGGAALHVRLGEAPDGMDDERFVEFAVELLRADRRYRAEMTDLLEGVRDERFVPESTAHTRRGERETRIARSEPSDPTESHVTTVESVPAAF